MVMEGAPTAGFQMIQPQIILGPTEGLFDLPTAATEPQSQIFAQRSLEVHQDKLLGLGLILWPIDHQPMPRPGLACWGSIRS